MIPASRLESSSHLSLGQVEKGFTLAMDIIFHLVFVNQGAVSRRRESTASALEERRGSPRLATWANELRFLSCYMKTVIAIAGFVVEIQ